MPEATRLTKWIRVGCVALWIPWSSNDYIYGPTGEPVEQVNLSSSTPTYLTYTASDSSWLATNNAGQQVAFWRYDAFGNLATGTPDSPFGYSGQYTDASTGFSNLRARFYEPQTGGFTTRDPAFATTDTAYTYAAGDPVNKTDPSGMVTIGFCGGFSGAVPFAGFVAGGCLTRTVDASGEDDIGLTGTIGAGGGGGVNFGASAYLQISNATNLQELGKDFVFAQVAAEGGIGASVGVFWNSRFNEDSPLSAAASIYGIDIGVSFGGGASVLVGVSRTGVHQFNGTIEANLARLAWDAAMTSNPVGPLAPILFEARQKIASIRQSSALSGQCQQNAKA
jgi:RHS repeat-associated protein